jgi:hypothetical protein
VAEHVREVWTQTVRVTGDLRIEGRWFFRPVRRLDVGPASVVVRAMNLSYGMDHPMATNLRGAVDITIHPFDVREPSGLEFFQYLSLHSDLRGIANTASFLETVTGQRGVDFVRGDGPLDVLLGVDHGKLEPGSLIETYVDDAEVALSPFVLQFSGNASLHVSDGGGHPAVHAGLSLSTPRVMKDEREILRASSISASADNSNVDLAHFSLDGATFGVDMRGARADSVAPIASLLRSKAKIDVRSKAISADGYLSGRVDGSRAMGAVAFGVHALEVGLEEDRVAANVQGLIDLDSSSIQESRAVLSGSRIRLDDIVARVRGVDVTAPLLGVDASRAVVASHGSAADIEVDLPRADVLDLRQAGKLLKSPMTIQRGRGHASAHVALSLPANVATGRASVVLDPVAVRMGSIEVATDVDAQVARGNVKWGQGVSVDLTESSVTLSKLSLARARDGRALLEAPSLAARAERMTFGSKRPSGTVEIELAHSIFPDLPALAEIATLPKTVGIEEGHAVASVAGQVDLDTLALSGAVHLATDDLRLCIGSESFSTDLKATIEARPGAKPGDTDLSGTTLSFTSGPGRANETWWARAMTPDALLHLRGGADLHARVKMEAKDASPAEALVATVTGVPRWLVETERMGHLVAEGTIDAGPSFLKVESFEAHGGSTTVHVEYAQREHDKKGAALIDMGLVHLGFKLGGAGPSFVLFGADRWFSQKLDAIKADSSVLLNHE